MGAKQAKDTNSSATSRRRGAIWFVEPCSSSAVREKKPETAQDRHLRYSRTETQFPASRDASLLVMMGNRAALRDKAARAKRFAAGAATVMAPFLTTSTSELTSAPAALNLGAASTSFSVEPMTPSVS